MDGQLETLQKYSMIEEKNWNRKAEDVLGQGYCKIITDCCYRQRIKSSRVIHVQIVLR